MYPHERSLVEEYKDRPFALIGVNSDRDREKLKEVLEEKCSHISMQERKAMEAERESVKYKQVEYIEKHIGEVFTGYISGMLDRGLFVELKDTRIEGLVGFDGGNHAVDRYFGTEMQRVGAS